LELTREARWAKLAPEDVIRKARIDPEEVTEKVNYRTTTDLANSIRECQVNVLRVAKSSINLRDTCQKDLKVAVATTFGMLEVLRTRADRTAAEANSKESRILKKEFQTARDSMTKEMALLR